MDTTDDYSSRQAIDACLAEVLGVLYQPLHHTMFGDVRAKVARRRLASLDALREALDKTWAAAKGELPLIKLAVFGEVPTAGGCLRHNANMLEITGIEGDYDGESVSPREAVERLAKAGVAALVYTSPSHRPEKPRWRVLVPLSKAHPPEERDRLCARLNGALGGILGGESFTRSQSYYFGRVKDAPFEAFKVDGEPLDLVEGLPEIGKANNAGSGGRGKLTKPAGGRDRSAVLFGLLTGAARAGRTFEDAKAAVLANPDAMGHVEKRSGKDPARQAEFIEAQWEKALEAPDHMADLIAARADDLEDLSDEDDPTPDKPRDPRGSGVIIADLLADVLSPAMLKDARPALALKRGEAINLTNAIALGAHVNAIERLGIRLNLLSGRVEVKGSPVSDADHSLFRGYLERHGMPTVGKGDAADALYALAHRDAYDPLEDHLNALPTHDGAARLDTWLTDYLNAEDTPYARAVGRAFLIAMVARAMAPGCKVDTMLVLVGDQGLGKSTVCEILAGNKAWFRDEMPDIRDAQASGQAMQGHWICEFRELAAIRKADVETLKAFLSRRTDKFRAPYAREPIESPRRCVFLGTTNESEFLSDSTGNRRYWPVGVGGPLRLDALQADRDQILAEALKAYRAGEPWHLSDDLEGAAEKAQARHMETDVWDEPVRTWLANNPEQDRLTLSQILRCACHVETERQDRGMQMRLGRIMRRLNWVKVSTNKCNLWCRPEGGR